jgi:hypothetical protein
MKGIEERLTRIEQTLERIEDLLLEDIEQVANDNNNRFQIKETRDLMQDICKFYKDSIPVINIEIGTKLHLFRFRESICKIKNIKNTKFEQRRLTKWIRKLEEHQFVSKINADVFQVLDTGKNWEDL